LNNVASKFSQEDRDRITAAVRDAESHTSGEIVPYVVDASDRYEEAEYRAGFLFAVLAFCGFVILRRFTSAWIPLDVIEIGFVTLAAGAIGMLLARFVRPVKTLFAGAHDMNHRVAQRAAEAFISEEVFNTRDRTGILVFVSLLEHRVLVVGDSGINARVESGDWDDIVQRVLRGIREGKMAEGLAEAIRQCGLLLQQHNLPRKADDRDELADGLRTSDR
jgi:putative membrane protein